MFVEKIKIQNFRNHIDSEVELSPMINVISGNNGSGKTSILETLSILSLSKSFLPTSDVNLISYGCGFYNLASFAISDLEINYKISLRYNGSGRKIINSTFGDNLLPKDIIGEMPVVILSPDYKTITFGSPADRRQFIDSVLSQSTKIYVDNALKLKKYLKQRNAILSAYIKDGRLDHKLLDTITELFIFTGADVIQRRSKFINEFKPFFKESFKKISQALEVVELNYNPDGFERNFFTKNISRNDVIERYKELAANLRNQELRRGTTLFGPQKDDFEILINGGLAKEAASQGQHKTLLISIKLAEYEFLKNIRNETPVFMLDDIFSELDDERSYNVTGLIASLQCQSIITVTNPEKFRQYIDLKDKINLIRVTNGEIVRNNNAIQ
jgi:DNA replication and repair protein RecF